jgi:hypothetical protein
MTTTAAMPRDAKTGRLLPKDPVIEGNTITGATNGGIALGEASPPLPDLSQMDEEQVRKLLDRAGLAHLIAPAPLPPPPEDEAFTPVRFWCAKYPGYAIKRKGTAKKIRFAGGVFVARNRADAELIRAVGGMYVSEDDIPEGANPLECDVCHKQTYSSKFFQEHRSLHNA